MRKRPETKLLPTDQLLLDSENPRLVEGQANQNAAALELARQQGITHVEKLARDIVENGLDPLSLTAVVPTKRSNRYMVIEGNRRLLALRVLDSPALVAPLANTGQSRRLNKLSDDFADDPIAEVPCVIFDDEEEAEHWIRLRHTGQNDGVGLVEWGSEEIDRYQARHDGMRSPAGQVLEFVDKHGVLSDEAVDSDRKVITNLERVLSNPYARQKLGVDVKKGQVIALSPLDDLAKSLGRLVDDFKTRLDVNAIRNAADREAYVDELPNSVLPKKTKKLDTPVPLNDLTDQEPKKKQKAPKAKGKKKAPPPRRYVVPANTNLEIDPARVEAVYKELKKLSTNAYTQACSVLSRVFLEMTVDHYLHENEIEIRDKKGDVNKQPVLSARLGAVATDLHAKKLIDKDLKKAITDFAKGNTALETKLQTFHQWVHNRYSLVEAKALFDAWDLLAPMYAVIWVADDEEAD